MTAKTPDGRPYFSTPEGLRQFAWYQWLIGLAAGRAADSLGLGFVPVLRRARGFGPR